MKYGPLAKSYEERLAAGLDVPDAYLNPPEGAPGDEYFLRAFWRLRKGASGGMGDSFIPWSDMRDYAMHLKYPHPEDFYFLMEAMDMAYMEAMKEKRESG